MRNENIYERINTKTSLCYNMKCIVDLVLIDDWNRAKTIWILNVLKMQPIRRVFDTFGEEYNYFIKHVSENQLLNYICSADECNNKCYYKIGELYFNMMKTILYFLIHINLIVVHFARMIQT